MFDPGAADINSLRLADAVVGELVRRSDQVEASRVMVVGAMCRDIIHSALGHHEGLRATNDFDVAVAVASWAPYSELTAGLERMGTTRIRFQVAGVPTDLIPFGGVEFPAGSVVPPERRDSMSVWAFQEVFDASLPLRLPSSVETRLPTVPGWVALKQAAWLDRSERGEYKDAPDLALAFVWQVTDEQTTDDLYTTEHGNDLLLMYDADPELAAVRLLGEHVTETIGKERSDELKTRWRGQDTELLCREMALAHVPAWTRDIGRRADFLQAFLGGMTTA